MKGWWNVAAASVTSELSLTTPLRWRSRLKRDKPPAGARARYDLLIMPNTPISAPRIDEGETLIDSDR